MEILKQLENEMKNKDKEIADLKKENELLKSKINAAPKSTLTKADQSKIITMFNKIEGVKELLVQKEMLEVEKPQEYNEDNAEQEEAPRKVNNTETEKEVEIKQNKGEYTEADFKQEDELPGQTHLEIEVPTIDLFAMPGL